MQDNIFANHTFVWWAYKPVEVCITCNTHFHGITDNICGL